MAPQATFNYLDAKSIACHSDGMMVFTSPNMTFVPEPHNGDKELFYCKEYEYAICICQSDCHLSPDLLSWAWYRPSPEDFEPLPHAAFLVGQLKQDKAMGIALLQHIAATRYDEWKKHALDHDLMVLLNHPLTFRDIVVFVAEAQRYFLDIMAFLDYVLYVLPHNSYPPFAPLPVRSEWMGCFTADTKVCDELFHVGVPVWLVRHNFSITPWTIIEKPARFTFPDNVIHSMYSEGASSQAGKMPIQAQTRRAAQKECTKPKPRGNTGAEMPASLTVWENAMKRVDKDPSRVKKDMVYQGYHVPEPAILISGQTPERRQLFMTNWLAIRPLWIKLELAPESSMGKKTAKGRKLAVLEIVGDLTAAMVQGSSFAPTETVEWRGKHILIALLTNPPPRLIRAILWEIYEIGWHYELCALDQALNPQLWAEHRTERLSFMHALFPGSLSLVLWSEALPSKPGDLRLMDSFCMLLSTWPDTHPLFSHLPAFSEQSKQVQAYEIMSRACTFYIQTFFDHFSRPPLLPHHFPFEYHE
ncbi:hypothetical protein V8E55_007345 [Tylopilus felleus]